MFRRPNRKPSQEPFVLDPGTEISSKKNVHQIPEYFGWLGLLFIVVVGLISRYLYLRLPDPVMVKDMESNPGRFVSERSYNDLRLLTEMGPRVTGTYNNEVLGVDYLKREIEFIQQLANKKQVVEMDHQIVSGGYFATFKPHGLTNIYQNVQNIVVKLHGKSSDSAVLLNCHFDSVAGSPGASDDAASCCVMLEVLRIISRQDVVNRHSIIFLFNGAEETPLQAAHGFVTQHKWAKEVKALLNWESVGSGGKEMLFQTGPYHPWLVKLYAKSAPHPNAQSMAEEVFQSGLIPSDTDFRIFRDFGGIVGMDFAHIVNGFRYHTRYDHIDYITHAVLQRTGDNCLALTQTFANSEYLDDPKNYSEGQSVFFDFGGLIFFNYSKAFGVALNISVALLSIIIPYFFLAKTIHGTHSRFVVSEILLSLAITFTSILLSLGVNWLISSSMDLVDKTMSWYTNQWMAIGLYSIPTVLISTVLNQFGRKNIPISLGLKIQARLIGSNLFHAVLTLVATLSGFRGGYVSMVLMVVFLVSSLVSGLCGFQNSIKKWMYIHVIGQIVTILWTTQLYHMSMLMFIPIAGRSGGGSNPDLMIGHNSAALTVLITSYLTPLVLLLRTKRKFFLSLLLTVAVFRFVFANIGFEFPYQDDKTGHPTPQRLFITHTIRNFYDKTGSVSNSDSGFWMREFDRNTRKTIESLSAPGTPIPQDADFCKDQVFCALPTYGCRQLYTGSYWLPSVPPLIRKKAKFELLARERITDEVHRLTFRMAIEGVTSLQIRPKSHVKLIKWSLLDHVPEQNYYNEEKGYFVMITHGTEPTPTNVTLDFRTPEGYNVKEAGLMDISVVTVHWEYHAEHTPTFTNLIAKVPRWAFLVPSVAAVDVFEY